MNKKGFTLIELLVVISIIGMLSTMAVVSMNSARQKSRDARRVADIKQIQLALELYYNEHDTYPVQTGIDKEIPTLAPFMGYIPVPPQPNDCLSIGGAEKYTYTGNSVTYTLQYCLGKDTAGITGNMIHTANPFGMK